MSDSTDSAEFASNAEGKIVQSHAGREPQRAFRTSRGLAPSINAIVPFCRTDHSLKLLQSTILH